MTPEDEKVEENKEEKEEEKQEEAAEAPAEEAPASEDAELEKELEDEEKLPFPNARVVALMKTQLDKEKMIRARVKKDMNEWLGKMCKRIAQDMNKSPYTVIEAGDLHRAIKKYEQLEEVAQQKERLVVGMQRIIQDCQMLISDIERSFDVGEEFNRPGRKLSAAGQEKKEQAAEE